MLNALIDTKMCSWVPLKQHNKGSWGEVMSLVIPNRQAKGKGRQKAVRDLKLVRHRY
jgi:hypothetical protein